MFKGNKMSLIDKPDICTRELIKMASNYWLPAMYA
jgi:hypothetical protein